MEHSSKIIKVFQAVAPISLTFCFYSNNMHFHNQRCTAHGETQSLTKGSKFDKPDIIHCYTKGRLDNLMAVQITSSVLKCKKKYDYSKLSLFYCG